jgi:hypothetical protein
MGTPSQAAAGTTINFLKLGIAIRCHFSPVAISSFLFVICSKLA